MIATHEGAHQHVSTLNPHLEFFSKAGSLFTKKEAAYEGEATALSLFQESWNGDEEIAFRLLLWLRDCRGGSGNRSGFRECLHWLAKNGGSKWISANLHWIPLIGRWDDLLSLWKTPIEKEGALMWAGEIKNSNVLAAKWCNRKNFPVKHALGIKKEGDFRKVLAAIRKEHIVEHKMSTVAWDSIQYNSVPSVAMSRYASAFTKKDEDRFTSYKTDLETGKDTVNASALFPHDCVRTIRQGEHKIADAQFNALPNYMAGTNEKAVVLCDTSGSMDVKVAGSIKAIDISRALALYCSEKIGKKNPFYKKFIAFKSESKFVDWQGLTFSEALMDRKVFDGSAGSTRIDLALNLILTTAVAFRSPQAEMPTALIIVSNMQFSEGVTLEKAPWDREAEDVAPVSMMLSCFEAAGYKAPKIIYWNTAGYAGSPDTMDSAGVTMVSGFSPSILKAIFRAEDFSPIGVMARALAKYAILKP